MSSVEDGPQKAHYNTHTTDTDPLLVTAGDGEESSTGCNLIPKGSIASSMFNLASATLGAGVLALPTAFAGAGVTLATIFLILCAVGTVYSIHLLLVVVDLTGHMSYEQMSNRLLGRKYEWLTEFFMIVFCFGVAVGYVVAIGDILDPFRELDGMPSAFHGEQGRRIMSCIFWALFMFPLSLPREINSLRYASFIGITAILYLVAAIVIHSSMNGVAHHSHAIREAEFGTGMLLALPLCMFSFCCQPNVFEIYVEMKNKSRQKMTRTAGYAMTVSTSLYIIAGIFGYADFGANVHSNILKNYHPLKNYMMSVAFFAISFTVTMAFPLCIFPTRDAILHILKFQDVHHTPTKVRVLISGLLAVGALILGLLIPNIVVIFGFLGGLCGSMIGFILPAWFALKTEGFTKESMGRDYYLAIALLLFGVMSGVLGTAVSIYETVKG